MRAIGAFAISVLVVGCQAPPPEMTEEEIAQIQSEVTQLAEAWMAAWTDVDSDCETAYDLLHPDYYIDYQGGNRITTRAEYLELCAARTSNRAEVTARWTDTDIRAISPDAAVISGAYEISYEHVDGSPANHFPSAHQRILAERTATGWGITFFINVNGPRATVEEG